MRAVRPYNCVAAYAVYEELKIERSRELVLPLLIFEHLL